MKLQKIIKIRFSYNSKKIFLKLKPQNLIKHLIYDNMPNLIFYNHPYKKFRLIFGNNSYF